MSRKIRKTILLTVIIVLFGGIFGVKAYSKFASIEIASSTSPDGQYTIVILEKKKWMSMPGNGSSRCVKVKLYKGFWRIDQDCDDCPVFSSEVLTPKWDMDAMQVSFALARSVNLITGECEE